MLPPNDVIADLPSPLDDEPPSVRRDIADELSDHLACAYRRELLKTADEGTAQQRVLDRFGNPRRIAYQLWFQALWGRIMLNRFARVWQGLKIVAGLVVLFMFVRMAEQQSALHNQLQFMSASYNNMQMQAMGNRSLLEQLLARLPAPPPSPEGSGMPMGGGGMAMGTADMGGSPTMAPSAMGTMDSPGAPTGPGSGMMPGSLSGGSSPAAFSASGDERQPDLKVRLTLQGNSGETASGCIVGVVDENGESLQPRVAAPQYYHATGAMGGSGGFIGGFPGSAGSGYPSPLFDGSGRFLGHSMRSGKLGLRLSPELQGVVHLFKSSPGLPARPLEPGRYTISIEFPDGRTGSHRFAISPGSIKSTHEEHIECPAVVPHAYILFRTSVLAQEFIDAGVRMRATLTQLPTQIGRTEWTTATNFSKRIYFDDAGAPSRYRKPQKSTEPVLKPVFAMESDISGLPPAERFLEMAPGDYRLELLWIRPLRKSVSESDDPGNFYVFPVEDPTAKRVLTLNSEMREIQFEVSDDAIEKLRQYLSKDQSSDPVDPRQEQPTKP